MAQEADTTRAAGRVHYVDWLRVLAVLLLFPFHTTRVFNLEPFYIKSAEQYEWMNYVLAFISAWHMQLLFFLAGASSYFALRKRRPGPYLGERVQRLLVPLVLGIFIIMPPQTWIGAQFNSGYTYSFVHYIVSGDFLVWNIQDGGDYYGGFGIGHLWFLLWLFAVSLMALPLMQWAKRGGPQRLERLNQRLAMPAWWLAAALLILIGDALPDVVGKNPFYFLAVFLLGFVAMALPEVGDSAQKYRWPTLIVGLALCGWWVASWQMRDALPDPSLERAVLTYLGCLGTWLVIVGAVGLGKRHLDTSGPALRYLAPASYPLYILHQTVIVVLAWGIVRTPLPWYAQWTLILIGSMVLSFAGYEVLKRIPGARAVIGVQEKRPGAPSRESAGGSDA